MTPEQHSGWVSQGATLETVGQLAGASTSSQQLCPRVFSHSIFEVEVHMMCRSRGGTFPAPGPAGSLVPVPVDRHRFDFYHHPLARPALTFMEGEPYSACSLVSVFSCSTACPPGISIVLHAAPICSFHRELGSVPLYNRSTTGRRQRTFRLFPALGSHQRSFRKHRVHAF